MIGFMFATGIENSYPTIDGGRVRQDELEKCGFYDHWRTDFGLAREVGVDALRFGPPLHKLWLGDGRYDWEFTDQTMEELKRLDLTPIIDLCHFGVPEWVGNFQNPDFPRLFACFASDFAKRFPWVQLYTPVNEMYVCATFSGLYGWWNEQLKTDAGFVTAIKHLVKANVMAMEAIIQVRPDAIFIQSESSEFFHPRAPSAKVHADHKNELRFLSLDLNYGHQVNAKVYSYLRDNGMSDREYDWFFERNHRHQCIMGNDYYATNEHRVKADGDTEPAGEVFGYSRITLEYFRRYRLPVMHTETNLSEGPTSLEAVAWLWKEWSNVLDLRAAGVPIVGFTWYSLIDQVDWDTALRENNSRANPLGLYDLDRKARRVGKVYKELIDSWRDVLPEQSVCLLAPISRPSEADADWVKQLQARQRDLLKRVEEGG